MGDSISSYYDDLAEREARELRERQTTVEYWRERALSAEEKLTKLRDAQSVISGFHSLPLGFDPVHESE